MLKKGALAILCLLAMAITGCVASVANDPAFQPKIEENGGPKALYSVRSDQLGGLFPAGSTLQEITLKYGNPSMTGSGTDKAGKPNSWAAYTYGRTYSHVDTDFNVIVVNRFTTATLAFDESGRLTETTFSRFQKYGTAAGNRDATEAEVATYLGAPEVLDIKAAPPASQTAQTAQTGQGQPSGWKLGAEISELRSEHAKKTGFGGRGVYVVSVEPQGLAARSGLAPGDVIVKVNGVETPTREDLIDQLKATPPTTALELQVFSKGQTRKVTVPAQQPGGDTSSI